MKPILKRTETPHDPGCTLGFKHFFIVIFLILLVTIITVIIVQINTFSGEIPKQYHKVRLEDIHHLPKLTIPRNQHAAEPRNTKCSYWDCFNVYRCGNTGHERISVYVYPPVKFVDEDNVPATELMSKQFYLILDTVLKSKYYTANPYEACLFLPAIDTLNQDRFRMNLTSRALRSLPYWYNGENHLIFNMIAGTSPEFNPTLDLETGYALIAGADFDTYSYRTGFDISIPLFSPYAHLGEIQKIHNKRKWLVVSSQLSIDKFYMQTLEELQPKYVDDLLLVDSCYMRNYSKRCDITTQEEFSYPSMLQDTTFCLIFRGERMGQMALLEAMSANCIPVIAIDSPILPFSNVLDWKRAAILVHEDYLSTVMDILLHVSKQRIIEMQRQVKYLYNSYFRDMGKITETVLDIVQDRVYPHWGRTYDDWNVAPDERIRNPLFFPITAPKSQGFTAVILTYDRVQSLFTLIEKLSKVPSLMKILVVWNNQKKSPPPLTEFPQISKQIIIIRTTANKLSNRFYPYEEIETECLLTIDDDIIMLTADELEFGYEVWREFPDRIVGFPSRTHVWDNATSTWRYESEWTNEISMVLTGAAFHHKYWSWMYTTALPPGVKDWVDEHMNCEDIAMNFLVANITNKPPIKVAPRKKFKCPECINNEMLSADIGHMVERSACVDKFAKDFGRMPLISVEFRADPVLYKDPFPEKLKRFNDIGSL